jgi:hypothetical protein
MERMTPEEEAMLTAIDPEPEAAPEPEQAPEPEPVAEPAPVAEAAAPEPEPTKPPPGMVPLSALHEEREARKAQTKFKAPLCHQKCSKS